MKNNKNKLIVLAIVFILLISGYFVMTSILSSKKLSGSLEISASDTDNTNINLNVSDFKNKATAKFDGKIEEGSITINILNSNDENLLSETINSPSKFDKEFKVNDFGDNIKLIIQKEKASGTINYTLVNKQ